MIDMYFRQIGLKLALKKKKEKERKKKKKKLFTRRLPEIPIFVR